MRTNISFEIENASSKTVILDSNLLLLRISFQVGLRRFRHFPRIQTFTEGDALLLDWTLGQFRSAVTTAYVMAEVSNLANKLSGQLRDDWFETLANYAITTTEHHVPVRTLGNKTETVRFGIADSALSVLVEDHVLLTSEYRLWGYLKSLGLEAVNFNHLRSGWLSQ